MPVARRWQNPERRLVLRPEAWPAADREAWARASAQGDLLDEAGPAASWSAVARKKRLISYGRWLGFLARTGRLEPGQGPAERVTRENVAAYLEALTADCAPVTVWGYMAELAIMLEVLAPEADHAWLRRLRSPAADAHAALGGPGPAAGAGGPALPGGPGHDGRRPWPNQFPSGMPVRPTVSSSARSCSATG